MTDEEKHAAKLQMRRLKEAAARQALREAKNEAEEELTPDEKTAKAKHEAQLAERRLHNSIVREAKKVIKDAELTGQTVDPAIVEYLAPKKRGRPARTGDEGAHPTSPSPMPTSPSDESSETSTVVGEDKTHGESKIEKKETDASKKTETKAAPKPKAAKPTPAAIAAAKKKAAEVNAAQEEDELVDELMEEPETAQVPTVLPATPVRGSREVSASRMFEESDSDSSSDSEEVARKEAEQPVAPPMVVSAKKPKAKATRAVKKSA